MTGAATILVVEDDANIADLIDLYLRREGYRVIQATSGERALALVNEQSPALVVLDIGLPGEMDGFDVCRRLRASSDIAVLLLTARDDEIDRIVGFEVGADDYVTKPFSPRELVVRVKAILRRMGGPSRTDEARYEFDGIVVDLARHEVRVDDATVALATKEFELLRYLCTSQGLALTRRQILDAVWGPDWVGDDRTVDVHVRQLRKKLGSRLPLATVRGVGYRLG